MYFKESSINELKAFCEQLKYLCDEDMSVVIADRSHITNVFESKIIQLNVKAGIAFSEKGTISKCIKKNNQVIEIMPAEVYGIAFKCVAIPIRNDNGQAIGAVSIAKSLKNQVELQELSSHLSDSISSISENTIEIASDAKKVSELSLAFSELSHTTSQQANETNKILDVIKTVANRTNLLGLNASIEAARAGDAGRGFAVVAEEISKLSEQTNTAITEVTQIIESIQSSVHHMVSNLKQTNELVTIQSKSSEEIVDQVLAIETLIQKLSVLSNKL